MCLEIQSAITTVLRDISRTFQRLHPIGSSENTSPWGEDLSSAESGTRLNTPPSLAPRSKQRLWRSSTAGQSRNGLGKQSQAKPQIPELQGL